MRKCVECYTPQYLNADIAKEITNDYLKKIESILTRSSWIRKMFEEGARLKALYGNDNVFDFSLGNPNLPPPSEFSDALIKTVRELVAGCHSYMPNAGLPLARQAVACLLGKEHELEVSENDIIMTCGAAGGLNVVLKTILNEGEEVIVPAPYFVEYDFYVDNHGGVLKTVPTHEDFTLDIDAIAAAVTKKPGRYSSIRPTIPPARSIQKRASSRWARF